MNYKRIILTIVVLFFLCADMYPYDYSASADTVGALQKKMETLQKQQAQTQAQLQTSKVALQKNVVQVSVTTTVIQQAEADIARKQSELDNLNERAELNKAALEGYLQEAYVSDQNSLTEFVLASDNFSDVSENFDQVMGLKDKIVATLDDISQTSQEIQGVQSDLNDKKAQHEKLLQQQKIAQGGIVSDINEANATLQQLNDQLGKLQSQLSSLLGSNFSTDDIVKAAKIAGSATGVDKDFLLGELVVESNLGKFTGGCTYDKSKMGSANLAIFKNITKSLGYDYRKMKVSCPLSYGIGGAMGIAQFMPSTWQGYQSRISSATGHNPPDPWNLVDGVTAMALYLKNRGAGSKGGERNAAAAYYCGSNIGRAICQNYAKKVLYWADNYDQVMGQ